MKRTDKQRKHMPGTTCLTVKAPALNGLADKGLLIGGEMYIHGIEGRRTHSWCQWNAGWGVPRCPFLLGPVLGHFPAEGIARID
jgi:hypothetical protein